METLYRKVAVSVENKYEKYQSSESGNDVYERGAFYSGFEDAESQFEEIPDNTAVIEKLEADKAELLEALEKCNNELHFYSGHTNFVKENESLIQKIKQ